MSDPLDWTGRVVVVTGGGSGIGAATCRRFADHGARVAVWGQTADSVAETVAACPGSVGVAADIVDAGAVAAAFAQVHRELAPPFAVVHAAGVDDVVAKDRVHAQVSSGQPIDVLADLDDAQWRRVVAVNLDGSFHVLRGALRSLRDSGGGAVVMIGSEAGVHGLPGLAHYGATKGGVHALVRGAATEAIRYGVRVNGIAPGVIDTPMSRRSHGVFGSNAAAVAPAGRPGDPDEIAKVAQFLLSDLASYVVGEVVHVDGGRMAC